MLDTWESDVLRNDSQLTAAAEDRAKMHAVVNIRVVVHVAHE